MLRVTHVLAYVTQVAVRECAHYILHRFQIFSSVQATSYRISVYTLSVLYKSMMLYKFVIELLIVSLIVFQI